MFYSTISKYSKKKNPTISQPNLRLEENIKRSKEKGYHIDAERVESLGFWLNKKNSNVRKEKSIFDLKKNTIHTCPVMPNTQKTI